MHVLLKLYFLFLSAETRKWMRMYSCMHVLLKLDFLFLSAETRKRDETALLHAEVRLPLFSSSQPRAVSGCVEWP
jgi:hypothetical protein